MRWETSSCMYVCLPERRAPLRCVEHLQVDHRLRIRSEAALYLRGSLRGPGQIIQESSAERQTWTIKTSPSVRVNGEDHLVSNDSTSFNDEREVAHGPGPEGVIPVCASTCFLAKGQRLRQNRPVFVNSRKSRRALNALRREERALQPESKRRRTRDENEIKHTPARHDKNNHLTYKYKTRQNAMPSALCF